VSQALTNYATLFESLRSRQKKPLPLKGLDKLAAWLGVRVRTGRYTLSWLRKQAEAIDRDLSPGLRSLGEAALADRTAEVRETFLRGRQDDAVVRAALAITREHARREIGEEAYVVQLMAAMALYRGRIVEMLTGEGKTLTGSITAPLLAWEHRHLHVLTVNDYLAKRDADRGRGIYERCMLQVGAIQQEQEHTLRAKVYALPIVYATPKQIVADWLRDQIRLGALRSAWGGLRMLGGEGLASQGPIVPGLRAAMVDEADAVLIDEAVVPLIIAQSRKSDEMAAIYRDAAAMARELKVRTDVTVDALRKKAELTRAGRAKCAAMFVQRADPIWRATRRAEELVRQAVIALTCYHHGRQYQIVDGRVVIVDEFTGRFLPDRSWEHGLHQAVEAKEGLEITADRETIARMSFQRFFRSYPVMCGMTGTAADATLEMEKTYQRRVTVIPTNRPVIRQTWPVRAFGSAAAKWDAVAESIAALHAQGRPILAGTRSIEASQTLAERLTARRLPHKVLNANFDKDEAGIIAQAGHSGAIVVATNMAGRGTDIKLDKDARQAGGLHVILTEMHAAKRVDRQFIGRAGRQGDPGSAQMFLSLEDELLTLYAKTAAASLKKTCNEPGELAGWKRAATLRLFAFAQRASQNRDRRLRAETLRQDDWVEKHLPGM
jgi:preprotein translocase subunit SecA